MTSPQKSDITLETDVEKRGVPTVAHDLGLTRSAVMQMIRAEREIYLRRIDGALHYCEYKDWKRGGAST